MGKDRTAKARGIAIGVLMIASVSACGGKVDDTPVKRAPGNCYAMCVRITDAKCGGDELESCTANCKQMPIGNCSKLLQAALDCAWWDAQYVCVDAGDRAVMFGCDAQWQSYLTCAGGGADGGS
jgi:hypothetical protein